MNTATLDSADGWPPLPSGPPPVLPPSASLPSVPPSRRFPTIPSTGSSFSGTPPPPGDYDTPPPPGENEKSNGPAPSGGGLAAWENAQKALAALNKNPKTPGAQNNSDYGEQHDNSWQGYPAPGWGPPVPPGGPMSRFPPPPYGYPPRPPFGYAPPPMPGMRMPPWGRPPMRAPHMGGQARPPMWGAARQPPPTSNATSTAPATTSASGQPIRFNLQFQKKPAASTSPQSIPLPKQPSPATSLTDGAKNPTPGTYTIVALSIVSVVLNMRYLNGSAHKQSS